MAAAKKRDDAAIPEIRKYNYDQEMLTFHEDKKLKIKSYFAI